MFFHVPKNINLQKLMNQSPPNFSPFKLDKLYYILSLITELPASDKRVMGKYFIPISAKELQKIVKNYRDYLSYLEYDLKLIVSDGHYKVGKKSKGYRFRNKYDTVIRTFPIKDYTLRKAIIKKKNKIKPLKDCAHLLKWYNKKLTIDHKICRFFTEREYELKRNRIQLWDKSIDFSGVIYKKPHYQFNYSQVAIYKMMSHQFNCSRDKNVLRFHSTLTNFPSILRNGLTYGGEKIISLDIKNSQPYLAIALLRKDFWKNKLTNELSKGFYKTNNNRIKNNIHYIDLNMLSIIMLGENGKSPLNNDFSDYINLIVSGRMYETFQSHFCKILDVESISRSDIKKMIFQSMFTDNKFIGQKEAHLKRHFKKLFPQVYNVFSIIKKSDKTNLPVLLQRIESHLIIDVISKRIAHEIPSAPIFTIHDSIATTLDFINDVDSIMRSELFNFIGYPPNLKREFWDTENMLSHLYDLEIRALKSS